MIGARQGKIWLAILLILCAAALGLLVFLAFQKNSVSTGGSMPLADTQHFTYQVTIDSGGNRLTDGYRYDIATIGKNTWEVTENAGQFNTGLEQQLIMDASGKITQADEAWKVGQTFNDLWLPLSERRGGVVLHFFDAAGDYTLGAETAWNQWSVWPAVDTFTGGTETRYYEAGTGWLVGIQSTTDNGDTRSDILSDT